MPHHVTLRGNPRQKTFFGEENYQHYLELIAQFCRAEQVASTPGNYSRPVPNRRAGSCSPCEFEPKALPRWLPCLSPLADWWGPLSHRLSATKPITSHEAVWPFQGQPCGVPVPLAQARAGQGAPSCPPAPHGAVPAAGSRVQLAGSQGSSQSPISLASDSACVMWGMWPAVGMTTLADRGSAAFSSSK